MFPTKTNAKITFTIFIRITRQGFIAWVFGPSTFVARFTVIIFILAKTEKRNELFSSLKSRYVRDERNLDNMIFQGKDGIHKRCGVGIIYDFELTLARDTYNYSCKRNLCFAQFLRNFQSTTC